MPGFSTITGDESIMFSDNCSFDGTKRGGKLTTDGQLFIGATTAPHIKKGSITSPGGSITVGYSDPDITLEVAAGSGITTIDGDTGSVTGSTVSIKGASTSGSTVSFTGSGTAMTFNVSDAPNVNTVLGNGSGTSAIGQGNTGVGVNCLSIGASGAANNSWLGYNCLNAATTASANTAIGEASLVLLVSGIANTCLGISSGENYTSSESSNIVISNPGVIGESNTLRIGSQGSGTGQVNRAFISGIAGVTVTNTTFVTQNSSTGQMGAVTNIPAANGGSLRLLSAQTVSNVASVNFTNIGSFLDYMIVVDGVIPITNTDSLQILISTDNGATYKTTGYVGGNAYIALGTGIWVGQTSTSAMVLANSVSSSSPSLCGTLFISQMNTGNFPVLTGNLAYTQTLLAALTNGTVGCSNTSFTAVNALQFKFSTGNISSGNFAIYGIVKV